MEPFIYLKECGTCKECCKSIPVCVCDYRVIEAILSDNLPVETVNKLRIYQIEKGMMNYFAQIWWYFPNQNLLKLMTIEEEGYYHILTIPRLKGGCPFLSEDKESGCRYPKFKPYNCAIYPYYQELGEFKMSTTCKHAKTKNIARIQSSVRHIAEDFACECRKNQEYYFKNLKKIQETYSLPKII